MKISILFRQYIWLVNTLNRNNGITFAELQQRWKESDLSEGQPLSRATFNRHKDAIEEIFGIYIICDRNRGYRYHIGNRHVLNEDTLQNWMLSTLTVSQLIHDSCALQERILIEPILVDNGILNTILRAMKSNRKVHIIYEKFNTDTAKNHIVGPLCIKLFRQRWYMLGQFDDGFMAVFALDRIVEINIEEEGFTIKRTFIAADYFDEYFGVITDQQSPVENILLRVKGYLRNYIDDLPIHHSQCLVNATDTFDDYEYRLHVTPDFISHLMSMGDCVEVIEPKKLAKEVARQHRKAAQQYGKKNKSTDSKP